MADRRSFMAPSLVADQIGFGALAHPIQFGERMKCVQTHIRQVRGKRTIDCIFVEDAMRSSVVAVSISMLVPLSLAYAQQRDPTSIKQYTAPSEHQAFIAGYKRLVEQYPEAWTRFILVERTGATPHPAPRSGVWVEKCINWPGDPFPDCTLEKIE